MASVSKRDEVFIQQAIMLYRGSPAAVVINVLNAALLGFILKDVADPFAASVWGITFSVLMVVRTGMYATFKKSQPTIDVVNKWIAAMVGMVTLQGLLWGAAAWVFMPYGQVQYHLLTAMVMFVLATGGMSSLYPVLSAYVAFVTPMMALLLMRFLMIGTDLHFAMAASGGTLLVLLVYFAKRHRDELIKSLMLRIENRGLLARLKDENEKVRSENADMARMEGLLRQKSAVLDAVSQVQSLFIADRHPAAIFDETLDTILQLTRSEYGFIGEVLTDEQGARYLKTFAVTDISWDADTKALYDQNAPTGMEFRNHKSLFGEVLSTGEPVISNDPLNDPRAGGLSKGHPPLNAFMGIPLYLGERMVGMVGLANRPGGYGDDLMIALDPVISAAASMVEALQNRRERDQAQRDAANAMERLTTAIEALNDGFVIYDSEDRLALCNSKYKDIYKDVADLLVPGVTFEEILRTGIKRGQFAHDQEIDEEWVQTRLAIHRRKESLLEQKLSDGTWLRIEERETPDGGHVGFRVDITELKRAQESLIKASQAKTEFLSSMSHELRTPMNAVLGFAQLLQMHPQVPLHPKQRDAVDQILKAGNHLLELINEILDLSRIESGRVNLTLEVVDPYDVIDECLTYIAPLAKKRGVVVTADTVTGQRHSIIADRTRF
ncbi:MAG TPA: PAS-domain containing protein, partial [Magnetovibrio sp.]